MDWQPIETAPGDGTEIDLWSPSRGRLADCYWGMETGDGFGSEPKGPGWVREDCDVTGYWHYSLIEPFDVTHWMTPPAPPAL